jgi:hypothetical protein
MREVEMTDTSRVQSSVPSRRTILLRGVACAAGAVAVLGSARNAHASKMPQASPAVVYQASPKGAQQCENCLLFQAPNACQVVDGTISPSGWCKLWAKKAA